MIKACTYSLWPLTNREHMSNVLWFPTEKKNCTHSTWGYYFLVFYNDNGFSFAFEEMLSYITYRLFLYNNKCIRWCACCKTVQVLKHCYNILNTLYFQIYGREAYRETKCKKYIYIQKFDKAQLVHFKLHISKTFLEQEKLYASDLDVWKR